MTLNFEDFVKAKQDEKAYKRDDKHPQGYTPGVEWKGNSGVITTAPTQAKDSADVDWDSWIDYWLGDGASKTFYIKRGDPINFRVWDAWGKNPKTGETEPTKFYYFKANLYSRDQTMRDSDFDKLLKKVSVIKPKPIKKATKNTSCMVVCLSDWQIGKYNTELAVENYLNGINKIKKHVTDLRKKHTIDKLVLVGMGDLLENCGNQFAPNGLWEQIYDGRQQMMIARRMLTKTIEILAPTFSEILCVAIAGNHGQKRQNGKIETSYGDNLDYELFDNVAEIFDKAPAFKHVKFHIPENDLVVSIEVLPNIVLSATHGHLARAGGTASHKILNWFTKMASQQTNSALFDTSVMLTGHYHHFFSFESDTRLFIGTTAQDHSGQQYFAQTGGGSAPSGTTTFLMHNQAGRKWSDINIL